MTFWELAFAVAAGNLISGLVGVLIRYNEKAQQRKQLEGLAEGLREAQRMKEKREGKE